MNTLPPPLMPYQQLTKADNEHLRLLGILGYVYAGLECLIGLFAAVYVGFGIVIVMNNEPMGWMVVAVGAFMSLWIIACIVLSFLTARWISQGKNWLFCMIVSGLHCASFPIGTALGVCSILVLCRPSVKAWFALNKASSQSI